MAFTDEKLDLVYQPIVRAADRLIVGLEVLVRWKDLKRGFVSPALVMEVAQETGVSHDLCSWILERCCKERSQLLARHPSASLKLTMSISSRQLMSPYFSVMIAGVLARTGTDPSGVMLEVDEQDLVNDNAGIVAVMTELSWLGIHLAMSNLGARRSAMNALRILPVETVKFHHEVITDAEQDPKRATIATALTKLGHLAGLTVAVAGIKTSLQHDEIILLGCDTAQGHFYSPPLTLNEVDALLTSFDMPLPHEPTLGSEVLDVR